MHGVLQPAFCLATNENRKWGVTCLQTTTSIAFDRTHANYVVFQSRGLTMSRGYWSRMLGHFRLWPSHLTGTLDISCWYRSISNARQDELVSQTALMWISKVRGYDHVCSKRSVKKAPKSQLQSNKTDRMHFSNLWLLLLIYWQRQLVW